MNDQIKEIAEMRENIRLQTDHTRALQDEINTTLESNPVFRQKQEADESLKSMKDQLFLLEGDYKAECEDEYAKTQDKDQPGGKVKIFTTFECEDAKAIKYIFEKQLDHLAQVKKSEWNQYMKITPLKFVTKTEVPKMTLSKDLSEFLPVNKVNHD